MIETGTQLRGVITTFGRLAPAGPGRGGRRAHVLGELLAGALYLRLKDVEISTGDVALFKALIDALGLIRSGAGGLIKDFNRKINLAADIERLTLATAPGRN